MAGAEAIPSPNFAAFAALFAPEIILPKVAPGIIYAAFSTMSPAVSVKLGSSPRAMASYLRGVKIFERKFPPCEIALAVPPIIFPPLSKSTSPTIGSLATAEPSLNTFSRFSSMSRIIFDTLAAFHVLYMLSHPRLPRRSSATISSFHSFCIFGNWSMNCSSFVGPSFMSFKPTSDAATLISGIIAFLPAAFTPSN